MGREMSTIMLVCPETGRPFPVGIETDAASFRALPNVKAKAHCPHCGKDHAWSKRDAWLSEPARVWPIRCRA
jgi:hypothetical protein